MTRRVFTGLACTLVCVLFTSPSYGQVTYEFIDGGGLSLFTIDVANDPATEFSDFSNVVFTAEGESLAGGFAEGPTGVVFDNLLGSTIDDGGRLLSEGILADLTAESSLPSGAEGETVVFFGIAFGSQSGPSVDPTNPNNSAILTIEFLDSLGIPDASVIGGNVQRVVPEPATATAFLGALMTLGCAVRRRS